MQLVCAKQEKEDMPRMPDYYQANARAIVYGT